MQCHSTSRPHSKHTSGRTKNVEFGLTALASEISPRRTSIEQGNHIPEVVPPFFFWGGGVGVGGQREGRVALDSLFASC